MDNRGQGSAAPTDDAMALLGLARQAAVAYDRPEQAERMAALRRRLEEPAVQIVVVGEFKQGKSTLINALLGAQVCPVDDDVATAVPTVVRFGHRAAASFVWPGEIRTPDVELALAAAAVTGAPQLPPGPAAEPTSPTLVEITLERELLAMGLTLIDTPGIGGLGAVHTARAVASLPLADGVLLVSDSSADLTMSEIAFLRRVASMGCPMALVQSKTDLFVGWREMAERNRGHLLDAGFDMTLYPVSSALRLHALASGDPALHDESGFQPLITRLTQLAGGAKADVVAAVAEDVAGFVDALLTSFLAEKSILADPEGSAVLIAELGEAQQRADRLRGAAARWTQAMVDSYADLASDADHDLRLRMRRLCAEADERIDDLDPRTDWDPFEAWVHERVAEEIFDHYRMVHEQTLSIAGRLAGLFDVDGAGALAGAKDGDMAGALGQVAAAMVVDGELPSLMGKGLSLLRGSYGGVLMFGTVGGLAGLALANPVSVALGLLMGRRSLKEEQVRALVGVRSQAKGSVRRFVDEVSFFVGKDQRDTLRLQQRHLREHFAALAESMHREASMGLAAAKSAADADGSMRARRLADVTAEIERVRVLRDRALKVAAAGGTRP